MNWNGKRMKALLDIYQSALSELGKIAELKGYVRSLEPILDLKGIRLEKEYTQNRSIEKLKQGTNNLIFVASRLEKIGEELDELVAQENYHIAMEDAMIPIDGNEEKLAESKKLRRRKMLESWFLPNRYKTLIEKMDRTILTLPKATGRDRLNIFTFTKMLWLAETDNLFMRKYNAFALGRGLLKNYELGHEEIVSIGAEYLPRDFWEAIQPYLQLRYLGEVIAKNVVPENLALEDPGDIEKVQRVMGRRGEAGIEALCLSIAYASQHSNPEAGLRDGIGMIASKLPIFKKGYVAAVLDYQKRPSDGVDGRVEERLGIRPPSYPKSEIISSCRQK